jgi:hypothetical protein
VSFEDLEAGAAFNVGDSFTTGTANIDIRAFTLEDGSTVADRQAYIDTRGNAGGDGQELALPKVNVALDFADPMEGLTVRFGEHGGNVNLEMNGAFANVGDFQDLNGTRIGGVDVAVASSPDSPMASISFSGRVDSVVLGGQELWLDDVCTGSEPPAGCLDFEDLSSGATFEVGERFSSGPAMLEIKAFIADDGSKVTGGQAYVDERGNAGGSGQDLASAEVNVALGLRGPVDGLTLRFGDYGGTVNLEMNGAFKKVSDLQDLDGMDIGGIQVTVAGSNGGPKASMSLTGLADRIVIGGQQLWFDDVCW